MTTVREVIKRDIGVKIEGVVKVFDRSTLANEVREYVVTDKIEDELKRIVDTFTQVSETLRRGGASRDVVGMWISGFFGSGKSHFAKVLGYLLQNDELGSDGERCIDVFAKHLSDSQRGKDVRPAPRRNQAQYTGSNHRLRDQEPPVADQPKLGRRDPSSPSSIGTSASLRTSSSLVSNAACSSGAFSRSSLRRLNRYTGCLGEAPRGATTL